MHELILYSTLGCHLCELALEEVDICLKQNNQISDKAFKIKEVDIADDLSLMEAYGTSIPVLYLAQSDARLYWPFDSQDVAAFLKENML
jgi:hypothetical protein